MGSDEKGLSLWIEVESASVAVGCTRPNVLSPPTSARPQLPPTSNDGESTSSPLALASQRSARYTERIIRYRDGTHALAARTVASAGGRRAPAPSRL